MDESPRPQHTCHFQLPTSYHWCAMLEVDPWPLKSPSGYSYWFFTRNSSEGVSKAAVFGKWTGQTMVTQQDMSCLCSSTPSSLTAFLQQVLCRNWQKYFSLLHVNFQNQALKSGFEFLHAKKLKEKVYSKKFQSSIIFYSDFKNVILRL